MPRTRLVTAIALTAGLLLASCASTPASQSNASVDRIVSTTSFGMCIGYCSTRLEISQNEAVLIRQARGGRGNPNNLPDQRIAAPITSAEWEEIAALASATPLDTLPEVIGCPDCADGGAESLAIVRDGQGAPRTITFDFNGEVAGAGPLLERIRTIRARLSPTE